VLITMGTGGVLGRFRRIQRDLKWANRRRRKSRRRIPDDEKPCGPKLVRGRGWARRRREAWGLKVLIYLLLSAAGTQLLFKFIVVPFLSA
jgi:hypothetical protein